MPPRDPLNRLMPFGKYRNTKLRRIPRDYLEWLLSTVQLDSSLKADVQATLEAEAEMATNATVEKVADDLLAGKITREQADRMLAPKPEEREFDDDDDCDEFDF